MADHEKFCTTAILPTNDSFSGLDCEVVVRRTMVEKTTSQNYDHTHHYSKGVRKDHVERGEDSKTLTQ